MGIKGVYGEIGSGTPTALVKLAVDKKEKENKNFRIAIDISIWLYQVQLGQGGNNADLRNIFYRLLRLLRLAIEPLIVFDGPHKPAFKRGKRTNVIGGSGLAASVKQLCDVFGFPYITAPGEAEAECASLQKEGLVDAVLSEDVDTLMFGCTMHLRNWDVKGKASHVDVYRADEIKNGKSGLDSDGMVLIALMSGGDYTPAGIPNCGIKIACEASRAGFGHDLVKIDRKDESALQAWRDRLQHELHTNESKFFRTKHKTLEIPEKFPDKAVLYYYTNPVVSTSQQIEKYRKELKWRTPDTRAFWEATQEFFDWRGANGLRHFIRNLAPALVGWRLANSYDPTRSYDDIDEQTAAEEQLIKTISARRVHILADEVPELRIAYIPQDIIGIKLHDLVESELDDVPAHTALYSGDEGENVPGGDGDETMVAKKKTTLYDPAIIERDWFPETFVRLGVPVSFEKWEAEMADPKKFATRKARARQKEKAAMPNGAIEKYLHTTKPGVGVPGGSVRATSLEPGQKTNVVSSLPPVASENLTELGAATVVATKKTRKTIPKSKPTSVKTTERVSTITAHTRLSKPGFPSSQATIASEDDFWKSIELFKASKMPSKHDRSPSPVRQSFRSDITLLESPTTAKKAMNYSPRPRKKAVVGNSINSLAASTLCTKQPVTTITPRADLDSIVCGSIETEKMLSIPVDAVKSVNKRSPFSRTISAPTNHATRPTYNPWKSIDDFDTSFETPVRPKNRIPTVIDLTLT